MPKQQGIEIDNPFGLLAYTPIYILPFFSIVLFSHVTALGLPSRITYLKITS